MILEDITDLKNYQQHLEKLVDNRTLELKNINEKLTKEIKEHRKSRVILENSERKYRNLVENANSIILRTDKSGTITFFNEFAVNYFGFSEHEILGKNVIGSILPFPDISGNDTSETIRNFLKPVASLTFNEVECIRKNKEKVWVAWTSKIVPDAQGNLSEFLAVGMDITERRQIENALHQVNAKLNLVSSIARHDILNRLTVIYGIISLLQEEIQDTACQECLKKAQGAAIAIKRQIEFTGDCKNMGLEKADWQNIKNLLSQSAEDTDLKDVTMEIYTENLEIFADPWLKRVFINLIDNTLHHGKKATKIRVSCHESDAGMDVIFQDDGIGIPHGEKEKIFDQDYGKNSGYGLFMAREILAITGLTIKETGEPGKGARFEIRVPKQVYRIT